MRNPLPARAPRRRLRGLGLAAGGLVLALVLAPVAQAGILDIAWNAPTASADGSPLTDLAGYTVYYGTPSTATAGDTPPCNATSINVGTVTAFRLTGLTGGTTYFVRVTALDSRGNESVCSNELSAAALPDPPVLSVTPPSLDFGLVPVGSAQDRDFMVQNTGIDTLSGTASATAPFTIVAGRAFSLPAGQSQAVTVRFSPTSATPYVDFVTFSSNGGNAAPVVQGEGGASPNQLAVTASTLASTLLTNGGFEEGEVGWTNWSSSSRFVTTLSPFAGAFALQIDAGTSNQYIHQTIPVTAGDTYTISMALRTDLTDPSEGRGRIEWLDSAGSVIQALYFGNVTGTTAWTVYTTTQTAPSGAAQMRIYCYVTDGGTGSAWFDEVAVVTVVAAPDEIHWTITGQTAVTVHWQGAENTLQYGLDSTYGQTVTGQTPSPLPFSCSSCSFWEAQLTGLQEDTLYHYAIGSGQDHTFRTPPPRGSAGFTVSVEGDIGDSTSYSRMPIVQAQIAADLPAFVLAVGDLTYGNAHGQAAVDQHFNDVMVWARDAAYMPAWGNHEWDTPATDDLRNYKGRFDFPNPQTSPPTSDTTCAGKPDPCIGEDWYWFDYGNVRFIAYPEPWAGAWAAWRTEAQALMAAAQADPAIAFIVTYGHRPAYSSGHHPGNSTLKGHLDALGASYSKYVLNLNGHSHNYERTYPQNGVVHLTAGTGGATLEQDGPCLWLICEQPSWSAFRAMRLGPVQLRFTATAIEGAFICGPAGGGTNDVSCTQGSIVDRFTIGAVSSGDVIPPSLPSSLRVSP